MIPDIKCRCGTPLAPHWVQREGYGHAATPVPPDVTLDQMPAPATGADPLIWGPNAQEIERWAGGSYPTPHDLVNRNGQTICHGNCVPNYVPDPVRLPSLEEELRESEDAVQTHYRRATWQPVQEAELLGEYPIAPQYAPFASEQDLLDAIDRETAKARMARVLLDDPRGVPPAYPPSREINAEDIERIMRREPRLDPNQYDRVRKLLLANLIPQGLALECPSALQDIYDATLDPADETFRSCYPSYSPQEPKPDGRD